MILNKPTLYLRQEKYSWMIAPVASKDYEIEFKVPVDDKFTNQADQ